MATKSQHSAAYQLLPDFLRTLREAAGLTQRELGKRLDRPQSWIYNCETANRRVDVTEFIEWVAGCGFDAVETFSRFLYEGCQRERTGKLPDSKPKENEGSG